MNKKEFAEKLNSWIDGCQKIVDKEMERFPNLPPVFVKVAGGNKYLKIQTHTMGGSEIRPEPRWTAYAFIDTTNGDVLRPATWKAPAKHARGNIFDAYGGLKDMGPYGPAYLR